MLPTQVGLRMNGREVQLEVNPVVEPWPAGQGEEDGDARRDGMFCTEDGTPHGQTMALIIAVVFVTPISWVLFSWSKEESDGSHFFHKIFFKKFTAHVVDLTTTL